MPRIADTDIIYIREHTDIASIVGDVVHLKPAGNNLKGLCPFHDERTPSFNVTPARGTYHCFGCGEGGDAINFVQRIQGVTFVEAVTYLADRMGHHLTVTGNDEPQGPRTDRNRLIAANHAAATYWATQLTTPEAETAVTYLTERGFTYEDAQTFGCGYSPNDWHHTHHHLTTLGFTETELTQAGLVNTGDRGIYDTFRGRLMFPIHNTSGDIIGFGARHLHDTDNGPKYLNTGETSLYKKTNVLYGIHTANKTIRTTHTALIVEGYTDVMACHLAGATNAVATCGTAFGEAHAKQLARSLGPDGRVIYLFDGDQAGQKAARTAYTLDTILGGRTYATLVPNNMDPCELRQHHGDQAIRDLIADPKPLFTLILDDAISTVHHQHPETQTEAANKVAPILAAIKDPILRDQHVRRAAHLIGIPHDTLTAATRRGHHTPTTPTPDTPGETPTEAAGSEDHLDTPPLHPALAAERATLRLAIQKPETRDTWRELIEPADYQHPTYRRLATNIDDPHPVLETLRRGLTIEPLNRTTDDANYEQAYTEFAREAVNRRLIVAKHMLGLHMDADERDRLIQFQHQLLTRKQHLTNPTPGGTHAPH